MSAYMHAYAIVPRCEHLSGASLSASFKRMLGASHDAADEHACRQPGRTPPVHTRPAYLHAAR